MHIRTHNSLVAAANLALVTLAVAIFWLFAFSPDANAVIGGNPPGVSSYLATICGGELTPRAQTVDLASSGSANFEVQLRKNLTEKPTLEEADRGCDPGPEDTAPAEGVKFWWTVSHGPCTGLSGEGVTDSQGRGAFSIAGCGVGRDSVVFSVEKRFREIIRRNIILTTYHCLESVDGVCTLWERVDTPTISTSDNVISSRVIISEIPYSVLWTDSAANRSPEVPTREFTRTNRAASVATKQACSRGRARLTVEVSGGEVRAVEVFADRKRLKISKVNVDRTRYVISLPSRRSRGQVRVRFIDGSKAVSRFSVRRCRV